MRRTGPTIPAGTVATFRAAGRQRHITGQGGTPDAGLALRKAASIAAIVAAGALAVACSSAPSPVTSATTSAPAVHAPASSAAPATVTQPAGPATSCTVITRAEASAALGGQPVQAPVMGKAYVEGGVACVFDGPSAIGDNPDIPYGDTVRVVLVTGPTAKTYFDDYQSKVAAQPIAGLGDEAFYDGYASISVLKGDAYVRIAVGIANNLSAEKTLAAAAVTRM